MHEKIYISQKKAAITCSVLIILLFSQSFFALGQEWKANIIGTCPKDKAYSIVVGDARNDGTNRVYVTTRGEPNDASIYEWTCNGTSWTYTTIESNLSNLVTIDIGQGRNDGVKRLYAVEWHTTNRRVLEYTWTGTSWSRQIIDNQSGGMLSCWVNDARGDGIYRVYAAGWIVQAEYTWNGSGWAKIDISTTHGSEGPAGFGDGRNDGVRRYYAPGSAVKEFTWSGSAYIENGAVSSANGWPETVVITDGRNDGTNRILTQASNGTWEYTWNGSAWNSKFFNGRFGRSYLYAAKTKADGKMYIYNTDIDSAFREYKYNSNLQTYQAQNIDAMSGATALVCAASGRNDDTVRIYAPNYLTGQIYEVTNVSPYVEIPSSINSMSDDNNKDFAVYCGVSSGIISVNNTSGMPANITIYSSAGNKVLQQIITNGRITIPCSSQNAGVYYVHCQNSKASAVFKILLIK